MRRVISMSALLSTLLALPAFADQPGPAQGLPSQPAVSQFEDSLLQFAELQSKLQTAPADVHHMRDFQRRMTQFAQAQVGKGNEWMLNMQQLPAARTEKGTFLGVTTSPVSPALRQQLGLTRGMGLVVDFVEKESPAEQAGVQVHDVLQKLDDQWLVNMHQLAVLVRAKKTGDTVTLTVIRAAKPVELKAKLIEKDVPVLEADGPAYQMWRVPDMKFHQGQLKLPEGWHPQGGWNKAGQSHVTLDVNGTMTQKFVDEKYDITVTRDKAGKGTIVAKDKSGKEVYSGPYTTDEDKKKVPADIADKIKFTDIRIHGGGEFDLQLDTDVTGTAKVGGGDSHAAISRSDDQHVITLTQDAKGKNLNVKDVKSGKIIYDGPANTEDDLKTLPQDVRDKVKTMQKNTTIHLEQK